MTKNPDIVRQALAAVRDVIGSRPVKLHEPVFEGNEWSYLKQCLDSTFVSSVGKFVSEFEILISSYTGAKHAVATVNGTAALHIALQIAGVLQGDEVLMPALTFVATANAVSYCGAVPHFVENEEENLGIDPLALRSYLETFTDRRNGKCFNKKTGRIIRAVILMHTFGHPSKIDDLISVARDFDLIPIEDAAESLGSLYHKSHTGTFGRVGILSFNGNKIITTGGGGAVLTNDSGLASRAKHLTTTAKLPHLWEYAHDDIGYNYRMPNLNAALGCAQLEKMEYFIEAKRNLFERYQVSFSGMSGICLKREPNHCRSNYWLQTLVLDRGEEDCRDRILHAYNQAGYMSRPAWNLLHRLKPYQNCPRMDLPVAESLEKRLINIPSSVVLGLE